MIIPPGGFIAFGSNTQATQALLRKSGTRKKRAKKKRATRGARTKAAAPKKRRAAKKTGAKFVKGSPAARRHMAKLRAMRKK